MLNNYINDDQYSSKPKKSIKLGENGVAAVKTRKKFTEGIQYVPMKFLDKTDFPQKKLIVPFIWETYNSANKKIKNVKNKITHFGLISVVDHFNQIKPKVWMTKDFRREQLTKIDKYFNQFRQILKNWLN